MYFVIKEQKKSPAMIKNIARRIVLLGNKGIDEELINRYLLKNYKIPLIYACLVIIANATYSYNNKDELIITMLDKELNKIADIITFGTGKIHGCSLLRRAFSIE